MRNNMWFLFAVEASPFCLFQLHNEKAANDLVLFAVVDVHVSSVLHPPNVEKRKSQERSHPFAISLHSGKWVVAKTIQILCWLKKQQDALNPDRRDSGDLVMWTSGLVFRKGEEIVGMETDHGILRIKLLPECAPNSVFYILELLALPHCIGCQIHRAESRGSFWDSKGNHIKRTPYGPPFALIQGTLESHGSIFKDIPKEYCPTVRRGSVAWVGSGPEFFISLADHEEWRNPYTVFGYVLSEDMEVLEKISQLPTKSEIWNSIKISILENPVSLRFRRMNTKS